MTAQILPIERWGGEPPKAVEGKSAMPPIRKTVERARGLRRTLSPPEVSLWQGPRTLAAGMKFRSQHPAGPFVFDVYCPSPRLTIEIDGSSHDHVSQIGQDERRDAWLQAQGVRVLRVRAKDVLHDLDNVMRHMLNHCRVLPLYQPAGGSPPQSGHVED